jgi:cell division protein FtsL
MFQNEISDVRADVEAKEEEAARLQQEIEEARRQLEVT